MQAGRQRCKLHNEDRKCYFSEAVEILARRANLELPEKIDDKEYMAGKQSKQQIKDFNKLTARYYYDTLFSPEGKKAYDYLLSADWTTRL